MSLGTYYGTRTRALVGWRTWVLDEAGWLLRSRTTGAPWLPGAPHRAVCEADRFKDGYYREPDEAAGPAADPRHAAPDRGCECGIYAHKESKVGVLNAEVTGTVELSGTVLEYQHGFRASQAYPVELSVQTDGAPDGEARAARIAEQLGRAYGVRVRMLGVEEVDGAFAQTLREAPVPRGLAGIARIAWAARERHDDGDPAGALEMALGELRQRDLRELDPGVSMGQALPAPFFLHETERRRWVKEVHGEPGEQAISIASLKGQAPLYYGPQVVHLDTRSGHIVERYKGCAGPRHRGHGRCPSAGRHDELTISRVGTALRLEAWIQVLFWHANPEVRGHAAALRRSW